MAQRRPNGAGMDPVKRADGRYAARVFVLQPDGGRKPKWVYDRDYAECLRKRDDLLARTRDHIVVPARDMKLTDWLDYWLEQVILPSSPYTTYAAYEQAVRLRLKPLLGSKTLPKLDMADIRAARNRVVRETSASAAKKMLTALRSALTAAMKEGLLTQNKAQLVDLPEVEPEDHEPWSPDQAVRFFRAAADHPLYAGFLLALIVGLRRAEIRGLRWQDVDLEQRTLHIRKQRQRIKVPGRPMTETEYSPKGKGRKRHKGAVGLPLVLVQPLLEQRDRQERQRTAAGVSWTDRDLVFAQSGGRPMNQDALHGAFKRLSKRLGLPDIRLHDLRHGASTMLADTGAKPHVTQAIMGHTSTDTTMSVYTHAALQIQREALDRVGDLLSAPETDVSE